MQVIKANGQIEPFSEAKVINSMRRAGVPLDLQDNLLSDIKKSLHENMSTSDIYETIIDYLGKSSQPYTKSKYSLKQALMMLGPTGYPFEDFIAKILATQGFSTQVRLILNGKCINHEIDVLAKKDDTHAMIEAKFHNSVGVRTDVHVPLYTKSRFEDLKEKYSLTECWVVTNTKTTLDAIAYANCVGIKILSWSYPEGASLRDLIEKSNLHPITLLTTLSAAQKMQLLENHIVLCKDIHENPSILAMLNLSHEQRQQVLAELDFICNSNTIK